MILLDTCVLLWLSAGTLPSGVLAILADPDRALFVSAISAWEIGVKAQKNKLTLPAALARWWPAVVTHHGLGEVPVEAEIAIRATALPPIHADPTDRILVATAQHLRAILLTPDPLIHQYPNVQVRWA